MEAASVTPAKRKGGKGESRTPRCNSGKKRHFINFCFGRNKGDDESDEEDEAPVPDEQGTAAVGDAGGHSGLTPGFGALIVEQRKASRGLGSGRRFGRSCNAMLLGVFVRSAPTF